MSLIDQGIHFNNKHSYHDFGLILDNRDIGNPSKIKVKERIPFSNIEYDFSELYNGQTYDERTITYTFHLIESSKAYYTAAKSSILNWVYGTNNKTPLKDDIFPDYYFLAEVEDGPKNVDFQLDGTITITFKSYPFRIAELKEGNDTWDNFNFILDCAQETSFTVTDSLELTLYNPGITVLFPTIIASSVMQIIKDGITYTIPNGNTTSYDFVLHPGENKIKVIGTGDISFEYYKELI